MPWPRTNREGRQGEGPEGEENKKGGRRRRAERAKREMEREKGWRRVGRKREEISLPTAPEEAPKTRWTCGAISAPFFSSSFSATRRAHPPMLVPRAFVTSPILILRELHGVPGVRGEKSAREGERAPSTEEWKGEPLCIDQCRIKLLSHPLRTFD